MTQRQPGLSCDKYRKLLQACKRKKCGCCNSHCYHISLPKKRAKNGTKHFHLLPAGFGCVGGELLPQAREFKYLRVLFASDGKMEQEIDRRVGGSVCGVAGAAPDSCGEEIYWHLHSNPHLWCELWVVTQRKKSQIQAAEKRRLQRVAGFSLTDREMGGSSE